MVSVIEAHGLTKLYAAKKGVRDLDLQVHEGEIFGYLGPNGSGKTTTIRLMLGFIRPDKGSLKLFGRKVGAGSAAVRGNIGYVPGEAALPENATGRKLLAFYERLSGKPAVNRNELCRELNLSDGDLRRPVRTLSRGTKQKIAIVQALQHDPALIILDEPTSGLDPLSQEAFFDVLHDLRDRGRTVFFSSHILSEVQRLCDRVAVLREGSLVLQSTMVEMAAQADRLLWVKFDNGTDKPAPNSAKEAPPIAGARFIRSDSGGWLLYLASGAESQKLLHELARLNPIDFRLEPALEESFLKLYGVNVRSLKRPAEAK